MSYENDDSSYSCLNSMAAGLAVSTTGSGKSGTIPTVSTPVAVAAPSSMAAVALDFCPSRQPKELVP